MPRQLTGIRRRGDRWRVIVRVHAGPGGVKSATFPLSTPVDDLKDWQDTQRRQFGQQDPAEGSFGADIDAYLARVAAMPDYEHRAAHLALWARELGRDRPKRSITAQEIAVVLQGWLETLAPGTVQKRRTALQSFFGGKKAVFNPVRETARPVEPTAEARAIDYLTIGRLLAAMPDTVCVKRGAPPVRSLGRIRAAVLAYTGLPPGLLQTIRDTDVQLTAARVRLRPRRKGKGVEARTLPLTAEGVAAFTAFHEANAYGPFAIEALNRSFKRAAKRIGLDPESVHLYDLRHSFGTELYRVTRDLATVARFMLHAEGSPITARYAKGANVDVDAAAAAAFSASLAEQRRLSLKAVPAAQPTLRQVK